jgi:hypothetical protein
VVRRWSGPELELIPYPDQAILREIYATTPNSVSYFGVQKHREMPAVSVVVSLDAKMCTLTVGLSDSQGIQFRDHRARHGRPPGWPSIRCGARFRR